MSPDITNFVSNVWRYKPMVIIVGIIGFIIFILLVIDAHRHRKKQKGRHHRKH